MRRRCKERIERTAKVRAARTGVTSKNDAVGSIGGVRTHIRPSSRVNALMASANSGSVVNARTVGCTAGIGIVA